MLNENVIIIGWILLSLYVLVMLGYWYCRPKFNVFLEAYERWLAEFDGRPSQGVWVPSVPWVWCWITYLSYWVWFGWFFSYIIVVGLSGEVVVVVYLVGYTVNSWLGEKLAELTINEQNYKDSIYGKSEGSSGEAKDKPVDSSGGSSG